jgi:hypothetical protein
MFKRLTSVCVLTAAHVIPCLAGPLTLISDRGLQGAYRYCEYSNGKTYGVDPNQSCPANIQEPAANGKGMGFFMGESHEGSNKLCMYRVSGQDRSIRVGTHTSCPLNQEF